MKGGKSARGSNLKSGSFNHIPAWQVSIVAQTYGKWSASFGVSLRASRQANGMSLALSGVGYGETDHYICQDRFVNGVGGLRRSVPDTETTSSRCPVGTGFN